MEHYLRDWREDAARKSQHETAIFVGDKIVALTCKYGLSAVFAFCIPLTKMILQLVTKTRFGWRNFILTTETTRERSMS